LKQLDKKPLQTKVGVLNSLASTTQQEPHPNPLKVQLYLAGAHSGRDGRRQRPRGPEDRRQRANQLAQDRCDGCAPQLLLLSASLVQCSFNSHSAGQHSSTAVMATQVFGLVWSGPSNHYWQQFLERTFKGRKDAATVVEKVIVDQLVYGPLCNVLLLSYISLVIEGAQRHDVPVDQAVMISGMPQYA
jgi:hypothetical protein